METDFLINSSASQKRRPYHYSPGNNLEPGGGGGGSASAQASINNSTSNDPWSERANYSRYLYYSRLRRSIPDIDDGVLLIPPHVLPTEFFYPQFIKSSDGKQNSIITIFAVWNTMMGTSLLSMPWAIDKAGVLPAVILLISCAAISFYTAYRMLQVFEANENSVITDFAVLCKRLLGRWAQVIAIVFSVLTLLGASIVYWILMSNFLFHTVDFIHNAVENQSTAFNHSESEVFCPTDNSTDADDTHSNSVFYEVWDLHKTVPFFLIVLLGPIACIRSPTFFTKFNSVGTLSVLYLSVFVISKWSKLGININLTDSDSLSYTPLYKSSWPALTGMLSLAFFIHNCVLTIMKNNRVQRNNRRDLGVAFILVALTYFVIGGIFFLIFPLDKECIQDNFLNNFRSFDIWTFTARIFLFFQMVTVFPLIVYILRVQVCYSITKKEPTLMQTFLSNVVIITICICFAMFLPKIGTIIRFTGAFCGLVYIFILPICLYLRWQQNMGTLTYMNTFAHLALLSLGVMNFVLQFVVSD